MSSYDIESLTIAESVCMRPTMYTSGGSLAEVLALFLGYGLAKRRGTHPTDDSPSRALHWLSETCAFPLEPSRQLENVLQHFGTEAVAFSSIAAFLRADRNNEADASKA